MTAPPSKELGESEVASELVPGNVEQMHAQVTGLRKEAKKIAGLERSFRAVRIRGWTGGAAEDWEDTFDGEAEKWALYGDVLSTAATALNSYTHSLSSAQSRAREAIALYKKGEAATAAAHADWQKAFDAYVCWQPPTRERTLAELIKPPTAPQSVRPAHPGPFEDPGEASREQARALLKAARSDLEVAGDEALATLGEVNTIRDLAVKSLWGGGDRGLGGPSLDWTIWERNFAPDRPIDADEDSSPFHITLGKVEGSLYAYDAAGRLTQYYGDVTLTEEGRFTVGEVRGSAEAGVGPDGLTIDADAQLTLVTAEGTVSGEYGAFQAQATVNASAGADAHANLTFNKSGVSAGAEAFIGASAGVHGQAGAGGVTVHGAAEVKAGVGAAAKADAGYHDGKVTFDVEFGLTVGVGGKGEFGVEIDLDEFGDTVSEAADTVVFWD